MSLRIRDMRDDDIPALAGVLARAYRAYHDATEAGMVLRLRHALAHGVQSFVARPSDEDAPVGMVLANDFRACAFVALMGVDPSQQRHGVGRALMAALTAWLDARGLSAELYATPEGRGLYLQTGFVDAGKAEVWHGRAAPGETEGVRAATSADHEAIRTADREAFGVHRASVLATLLESPEHAVFVAPGGYAVAQRSAKVLGPVVAPDAPTAARLLRTASAALDAEHRVNAPARDDVRRLLEDAGYQRDRAVTRMIRGTPSSGARERIWVMVNLGQG